MSPEHGQSVRIQQALRGTKTAPSDATWHPGVSASMTVTWGTGGRVGIEGTPKTVCSQSPCTSAVSWAPFPARSAAPAATSQQAPGSITCISPDRSVARCLGICSVA